MLFGVVWTLLGLCTLIQLYYHLRYFAPLRFGSTSPDSTPSPSVSVVICAHNERDNLKTFLPKILEQQYIDFEVIVVSDRSDDGSVEWLQGVEHQHLRVIEITEVEQGVSPKKNALEQGFKAAKGDWILLTDADCYPVSKHWISKMVSQTDHHIDLVLGVSPYEKRSGVLNALIRFDTFFTAMQYLGLAKAGHAYMGVGRNLLVRREAFFKVKGFEGYRHLLAGDDDILVSKIAGDSNTAICLDQEGFTVSQPKTTWSGWFKQKRRHLGVGLHYKKNHFWRIAVFQQTYVWQRILLLVAGVSAGGWIPLLFYSLWMFFTIGWIYHRFIRTLGNQLKWYSIIPLEILYFFYLLGVGTSVIIKKSRKWE